MVERGTLVEASDLDQLSADQTFLVMLTGRRVGLLLHQGQPVAVLDRCPHFSGPLAQGSISTARGEIICPWHRFRFDLTSGQSVTNPAMAATLLPTEVRGDRVWVDVSALKDQEE
jgi:3-phenylpropionate/trans-cinnamate dioxygenase ferredoxin subunit